MTHTLTLADQPVSVQLLDACSSCSLCPIPPIAGLPRVPEKCAWILGHLVRLEGYIQSDPELSWQLRGYRITSVYQREADSWDITFSNHNHEIVGWIRTGFEKSTDSLFWTGSRIVGVLQRPWRMEA